MLLREQVSRIQLVAALLILPGTLLLVPSFSLGDHATVGVLWGLGAAATFALLSITNRHLTGTYPSITISLYQDVVAALVLLPLVTSTLHAQVMTVRSAVLLLIIGILCTAVAHTLFVAGLRTMSAQLASLLAALEPVWGIAAALLLLHQIPTSRTIGGGVVILTACLVPGVVTQFQRS